MFESFTDPARHVVLRPQEEARALRHSRIGTEHLLLGLLDDKRGAPARVLKSWRISLKSARQQVERLAGRGEQAPAGHIPLSPLAMLALQLAASESADLGHDFIGPEHLLLGVAGSSEGLAAQVLTALGADPERVRQRVLELTPPAMPAGHDHVWDPGAEA
ncbi:MAG TPA: Clp protease N-terminal domain-containing protein [Streptosporangiaceae bacterium]|jgi:ATP-dependent Clp protease ATP-binding subunit ClpC